MISKIHKPLSLLTEQDNRLHLQDQDWEPGPRPASWEGGEEGSEPLCLHASPLARHTLLDPTPEVK